MNNVNEAWAIAFSVDKKTRELLENATKALGLTADEYISLLIEADSLSEDSKLSKVKELTDNLAESNNKCYTLESYNKFLNNQCKKLIKEDKQVKQQLTVTEMALELAVRTIASMRNLIADNVIRGNYTGLTVDYFINEVKELKANG